MSDADQDEPLPLGYAQPGLGRPPRVDAAVNGLAGLQVAVATAFTIVTLRDAIGQA